MKTLFTILALFVAVSVSIITNPTYCNSEESTVNATITDREGKSQDVNDTQLRFIKNNWVNIKPQVLNHFYLGIRYADSGSYKLSEVLFFPLKEIKEIDFKDEFPTGEIIRKRDGSYIDIQVDLKVLPHRETISFYAADGGLISTKKINYYRYMPSEKADPDWMLIRCEGFLSGNNKKMEKYSIEIPHDIRKIVFY